MRTRGIDRLAVAMLERMEPGGYGEALGGDLLEELGARRRRGWFWREVGWAMARSVWRRGGRWGEALAFSVGWTVLYPAWRVCGEGWFGAMLPGSSAPLAWPVSSVVDLARAGLPALTFVWFGLLVYLLLRVARGGSLSWFRVVWGLSTSLSVLLVAKMVLLGSVGRPGETPVEVASGMLHGLLWGAPLMLSVLTAVVGTMPARRVWLRRGEGI